MNIAALKTELTDDPLARGYAGMSDEEAAADLNVENREVNVTSVTGQDIFEAATLADYAALDATEKSLLHAIIGMGTVMVNGTNTKAALLAMFGAGSDTRDNLAVLQKETVTRANELGLGGTVYPGQIQAARV